MKRSEINRLIREAEQIFAAHGWHLPDFASFPPEKWATLGAECDEIRDCALGWDVTDFGFGEYDKQGLFLFTVRTGKPGDAVYRKVYAEKLMLVKENQVTPYHYHWTKMEDIINRGGGNLVVKVYGATEDDKLADTPVTLTLDGRKVEVAAGTVLTLAPGQSVTFAPYQYHSFWGEPGRGPVVVGEVSMANDDNNDNCFLVKQSRFPAIEEDEPAYRLLCNEYPRAEG